MTDAWRHVFARFGGFIEHLRPTESERCDTLAAATDVARCLRSHFRPLDELLSGGFPGAGESDYLIIGGHGKGTAIRPADIIDILYVLPVNIRSENRQATGGQSLGLELAAVLRERLPDITHAPEGWLAVRPGGDVARHCATVRLIPCFPRHPEENRSGFLVADPGSSAAWRVIDPTAEMARLEAADAASGNKASHLILMLKAWRQARRIDIGALALELLVTDFVSVWTYHRRGLLFYDWMVRDFFFWLRFQRDRAVPIPGSSELLAVGGSWLAAANEAYGAAKTACLLERDNAGDDALAYWEGIFGAAFIESQGPPAADEPPAQVPRIGLAAAG
ncbi:MAG: hypothetical protein QGF38_09580 [Rhodospirillales bacterium]|jgi:hypothetical protein|nr:hypothetical protein [Rhodospirillales bacterium]